jgi:choline dehydrogenase-like flavoprotein
MDRRVVVVGSGPPGAAAALFLARAGVDVLVLDAGVEQAAFGLTLRVRGYTVVRQHRTLCQREDFSPSGGDALLYEDLAPGGLTNHWSCAVPRYAPDDFADARRAGEAFTWPLEYEDIEPWYARVEPLLRIAGSTRGRPQLPAGVVQHRRELGSDWTAIAVRAARIGRCVAPMPYAYGGETTLTPSGTAFNSFVRLLRPEIRAGRIAMRFGARVLRLERTRREAKVDAVVFKDAVTGVEERMTCAAVVLAAGAVGTAEVLFASADGEYPDGLGNTHGVLGRYLHDHPLAKLVVDLGEKISVQPPSYWTRPTLRQTTPLYAAACMQWSGTSLLLRSLLHGTPRRLPWIGFSVFGTIEPSRDNWIAPDPTARPRNGRTPIRMNFVSTPQAIKALENARQDVESVLADRGLSPRVRDWVLEKPGNSNHYGGTCRMHASPQYGMLDGWSRMHAVPNVAVVDSSAFTTGPEKNPVLTAMALAARAGDRLGKDLRASNV